MISGRDSVFRELNCYTFILGTSNVHLQVEKRAKHGTREIPKCCMGQVGLCSSRANYRNGELDKDL